MRKMVIMLLSLTIFGCANYNYIQTTPISALPNISNCTSQTRLYNIYTNQTKDQLSKDQLSILKPNKQNNFLSKPEVMINQTIINTNAPPLCNCDELPMFPANYFVTYEPINDYPVTYRAKYVEYCRCY